MRSATPLWKPFSRIVTVLLLCLTNGQQAHAQKEDHIWYFGFEAGLSFHTNPPTVLLDGAMSNLEGVATISDAAGNLLFYTNGIEVWDRTHQVMPNGTGLLGDYSSSQSAVIVPAPGQPMRYYLFTLDDVEMPPLQGLHYSEIDLTLNGGLGDVVPATKNTPLLSNATEKLAAVPHSNGTDYWIIAHSTNSADFYVYQLSATGLSAPQVQTIGTPYTSFLASNTGCLEVSADGTRLAACIVLTPMGGTFDLFDFDPSTGQLSNHIALDDIGQAGAYGAEFSPSGQFLYATSTFTGGSLFQFDLSLPTAADIEASRQLIYNNNQFFYPRVFGALQLAPDGKIYVAWNDTSLMSCIEHPDQPYPACNFVLNAVDLSPATCSYGLPNVVRQVENTISAASNGPLCLGDSLSLFLVPDAYSNLLWTGPHGFSSTNPAPVIDPLTASDTGEYRVEVYITLNGSPDTLRDTIRVVALGEQPEVVLPVDTVRCPGLALRLFSQQYPSGSYGSQWQNGSNVDTLVVASDGWQWLEISNVCGSDRDSTWVETVEPPSPIDLGEDQFVCPGDTVPLPVADQPGVMFRWDDGSQGPNRLAMGPGRYHLTLSNACGRESDTLHLRRHPVPEPFTLAPGAALCPDQALWLTHEAPGLQYLWSDGSQADSLLVAQPGLYWLELSDSCGLVSQRDSVPVDNLLPPTPVELGADTTLCQGETWPIALPPDDAAVSYLWSDGSDQPGNLLTAPGLYWVELRNACGVWRDSLRLTELVPPVAFDLGASRALCAGQALRLGIDPQPQVQYQWQDGFAASRREVDTPGIYQLIAQNRCGQQRDQVRVRPVPLPDMTLPNDTLLCLGQVFNLDVARPEVDQYQWQDGRSGPSYQVRRSGTYWVWGENACGRDTAFLRVQVDPCDCEVFLPSAFTPNQDGLNEGFGPLTACDAEFIDFQIFNRWGQRIYRDEAAAAWNGTYQGRPAPLGVYTWVLRYRWDANGTAPQRSLKGTVTLLR